MAERSPFGQLGLWEDDHDDLGAIVARLRRRGRDDEQVEVKACGRELSKDVWDSVSAFANTHGGLLVRGLSEDGGFTPAAGFAPERVLDQFVTGIGDGGSPGRVSNPPNYALAHDEVDGSPVLRVRIDENAVGTKPCFVTAKGVNGGSFKRIGDKDVRLTPLEIYEFQNALLPSTADRDPIPEAEVSDLSSDIVERLVARRAKSKALRGTSTDAERMARLNLTAPNGAVRLAGLLATGLYPQQFLPRLYIDVAVHPANENSQPGRTLRFVDRVRCEGPLTEMIDEAVDATARNLRTYSVVEGAGRRDQLEIPREVLREAIANAVVHREYHELFRGEPVTVDVYPDRVVVANPGGLWGGKTEENLDDGTSRCRNQTLMQLLSEVPSRDDTFSVEGQGGGIKLMIHEMEAHAMGRPRFRIQPDRVAVELACHGAEVPAQRDWLRSLSARGLTAHEDAALLMACREGLVSAVTLRRELRIDSDEARELLSGLAGEGLLRSAGQDRYILSIGGQDLRPNESAVLQQLSPDVDLSIHELAEKLEKSANTLRPVLRSLIDAGWVEPTASPQSRNRKYRRVERDPRSG